MRALLFICVPSERARGSLYLLSDKRLGRFSKASMRETNIITSPREVQKHEKRNRGEQRAGEGFFFSLQGSRRGHGHSAASRTADVGVSLFLMGKCHSIALAVLFTGPALAWLRRLFSSFPRTVLVAQQIKQSNIGKLGAYGSSNWERTHLHSACQNRI